MVLPSIFLSLGVLLAPAVPQSPSALVGDWVGQMQGIEIRMVLRADGTGEFAGEPFKWRTQGNQIFMTDEEGIETYAFRLQGSQLTLSGGDLAEPLTFRREGGGPGSTGTAPPVDPPAVPRSNPLAAPSATRPKPGAATEPDQPRHVEEAWGLSFRVPPAWQVGKRQGLLLLGSNTEPGLLLVRFVRKTSLAKLKAEFEQGLSEEGLQLSPVGPARERKMPAGPGLEGELSGVSQDGARLRARAIAVASQFGDAAVVLGLTTEEKFAGLKPRVEELAGTFAFTEPKVSPAASYLAGQYWYYSGHSSQTGGSYSSERKLNLCSDGTFSWGGETHSSGGAGIAAAGSSSTGRWTAQGDENQGTLILTYDNGQSEELEYEVSTVEADRSGYGPAVSFGGKKYQKTGDGSCGS